MQYDTADPLTLTNGVTLNAGGGTFDTNGFDNTIGSSISGVGSLTKTGAGTLALTNANSFGGGTNLNMGTILVGNASALSSGTLAMANGTTLDFTSSFSIANAVTLTGAPTINVAPGLTETLTGLISDGAGAGTLNLTGAGTLILTADNTYSGGTTINTGTLQLGNGGSTGSIVGNVANNGTLVFNRSNTLSLGGLISGSGGVDQIGSGTTVLSGTNSYAGATNVNAGALYVNGNQSAATGLTTVASGATLGGTGVIGGSVIIANDATLAPGDNTSAPGTLTINGNLNLNPISWLSYSFGQANVPGGPLNDLTIVHGNLTLDGTLNVTTSPGGSFDPGVYRVISYDGTLTNNGLAIGTIPSPNFYVQTSVANQVNLVNTAGLTLNFWDGDAGPKNNSVVNGGNGTWQNNLGNDNWTTSTGTPNAPFSNGSFAIFEAAPGVVNVDNSLGQVNVAGMQFASNGYLITGQPLNLVGPQSIVRVGDGSSAGAGFTATIDAVLMGDSQLVKTDLGTLVLSGANIYTGGTQISGGTLSISSDGNLGAASGDVTLDGGTLETTASFATSRAFAITANNGAIQTDTGTTYTVNSAIADATVGTPGGLTKTGDGTLVLTGTNTYSGGTFLNAGTILIGNASALGASTLAMADGTMLDFTSSFSITNAVTLTGAPTINVAPGLTETLTGLINDGAGAGTLNLTGAGTLILIADNTYSGGTTINTGTLQLGNGGSTGGIVGNVANDGTLVFNRSNTLSLGGVISGSGGVDQIGSGTTVLSGANSYSGPTNVQVGTLAAGAVGTFSPNSAVSVASASTLDLDGFSQTIPGLTNSGLVNMGTGTAPGTVLTVTGNYVGNGGTIAFNTVLGNDSSLTDRMVVGGSISGSTNVLVTNAGGAGAVTVGNGIELVTNNNNTTAGAFTLAAPVVAGPYDYTLFHGSVDASRPQNWYLRSTLDCSLAPNAEVCTPPTPPTPPTPRTPPHFRVETSLNAALPAIALLYGRNLMDTLHERVGDEEDLRGLTGLHQNAPYTGGWARLIGTGGKERGDPLGVFGAGPQYSYGFVGLQGGQDLIRYEHVDGSRDRAGVTFAVGGAHGNVTHFDGTTGNDDFQAYTLGGYWTHFGALGWYVDTMLQGALYNARTTANRGLLPFKTNGDGIAGSVEAGYPFKLVGGYFIEPQAQLIYQNINFNSALDNEALVKFSNVDSLIGRIGARFGRTWSLDGNAPDARRITAWIRPNVWQEFRGNPITQFSSEDGFVPFRADLGGTWGEVNVGVSAQINLNTTLFANASYQARFNGKGTGYDDKAGVRVNW